MLRNGVHSIIEGTHGTLHFCMFKIKGNPTIELILHMLRTPQQERIQDKPSLDLLFPCAQLSIFGRVVKDAT